MAAKLPTATRMALLATKKRIKLATKGHKLLKEKRDALISEFFSLVEQVKGKRHEMEEQLDVAFKALIMAQATDGLPEVRRAAEMTEPIPVLEQDHKAIMGLKVPTFSWSAELDPKPRYSLVSTSVQLDEAARRFCGVLGTVTELAELEAAVRMIAEEIKKTKRKVNALERVMLPRLEDEKRYIAMRLEEMSREEFGRLKIIKENLSQS